jgi:hypothetical protein
MTLNGRLLLKDSCLIRVFALCVRISHYRTISTRNYSGLNYITQIAFLFKNLEQHYSIALKSMHKNLSDLASDDRGRDSTLLFYVSVFRITNCSARNTRIKQVDPGILFIAV